jgi:hypothetical protein
MRATNHSRGFFVSSSSSFGREGPTARDQAWVLRRAVVLFAASVARGEPERAEMWAEIAFGLTSAMREENRYVV